MALSRAEKGLHPRPIQRSRWRPDGTRRRTQGELQKRRAEAQRRSLREATPAPTGVPSRASSASSWAQTARHRQDGNREELVEVEVEVAAPSEEPTQAESSAPSGEPKQVTSASSRTTAARHEQDTRGRAQADHPWHRRQDRHRQATKQDEGRENPPPAGVRPTPKKRPRTVVEPTQRRTLRVESSAPSREPTQISSASASASSWAPGARHRQEETRGRAPATVTAPTREPRRDEVRRKKDISKAMSQILRHTGRREGLEVESGGYASLSGVLQQRRLMELGATPEEVLEIAADSSKQRFHLQQREEDCFIRAAQGHSFHVNEEELLVQIHDPGEVPVAVHGTQLRFYEKIHREGLRPGRRQHIHFATSLPTSTRREQSGMRASAEILIYLDVDRALREGMRIYRSTNDVILTAGFSGLVHPRYFSKVQYYWRGDGHDVGNVAVPSPGHLQDFLRSIGVSYNWESRKSAPDASSAHRSSSRRPKTTCRPVCASLSPPAQSGHNMVNNHQCVPSEERSCSHKGAVLFKATALALHNQGLFTLVGIVALMATIAQRARTRTGGRHWIMHRRMHGIYRRRPIPAQHGQIRPRISTSCYLKPHLKTPRRSGPKSRGRPRHHRRHMLSLLFFCLVQKAQASGGLTEARVVTGTSTVTRVTHATNLYVPQVGENTGQALHSQRPTHIEWTAKRALRRARARAERTGGTYYKGQWYHAEQLTATRTGWAEQVPIAKPHRPVRRAPASGRIRVMTWNIGGASSQAWQELMLWLQDNQQRVDVVLIQETHWKLDGCRDFNSGPWHVLSAGAKPTDSKAGVATLVHKRLGPPTAISSQTILQGRLQHVRIQHQDNCTDIFNVYQHIWRSQMDEKENRKHRDSVWKHLRQHVAKIPQRNSLAIGGDFNCTVRQTVHHVGSSLKQSKDPSRDMEDFLGILQDLGLTLLNTWHCKPAHTCVTSGVKTQLDFLMCRVQHADKTAKSASPLSTCALGRWKANHHVPVLASFRLIRPFKLGKQEPPTSRLAAQVMASMQAGDEQAKAALQHIQDGLGRIDTTAPLSDLSRSIDDALKAGLLAVYKPTPREDDRISQQPSFIGATKTMWEMYRAYKQAPGDGIHNAIRKHQLWMNFKAQSVLLKQHTKALKKQKLLSSACALQHAAKVGDQKMMWKAAKQLAPWKPKDRANIRGKDGDILKPQDQLKELLEHSITKFCNGDPYHSTHHLARTFGLTEEELQLQLCKVPTGKALPSHLAPAVVWKACAEEVSTILAPAIRRAWGAGSSAPVPQDWQDTFLVWLRKPNKDPHRPQGLRPIGLAHPVAKTLCRILRERIQPILSEALRNRPQFAYTAGRGVLDALLRVHSHFRKARNLSLQGRTSIYDLFEGKKRKECVGGLCFSLDLEGAFDGVPRPALACSLRRLRIDEDLLHLLMGFHTEARYHTEVGECKGYVTSSCGIKQGCTVAPYLFVAHTIAIIDAVAEALGWEWARRSLTLFADDSIATWVIQSLEDLHQTFRAIQTIITIFNQHGMVLAREKSVILHDITGRQAHKFLIRRRQKKNNLKYYEFEQQGQPLLVQHKKAHEYLGTIVSYRNAQALTLDHRLSKARGQYSSLRKAVNSPHIVSNRPRYQIWRAGVLSSATYGLLAVGMQYTGKAALRGMASRQMRAIARRPAHITHVSNEEICRLLHAQEPITALYKQGAAMADRLDCLASTDVEDIRGAQEVREQLRFVLDTMQDKAGEEQPQSTEQGEVVRHQCPHCERGFDNLTSLRKHVARSHKEVKSKPVTFDAAKHALGGLPQCVYCLHKFQGWCGLKNHIQKGHCPKLPTFLNESTPQPASQGAADAKTQQSEIAISTAPPPPLECPEVLQMLEEKEWTELLTAPIAERLKQHCALCKRWIVDPTALKRHFKQTHKKEWNQCEARLEPECRKVKHLLERDGTCQWCQRTSYNRHYKQCNIVWQSALLGILHGDRKLGSPNGRRIPGSDAGDGRTASQRRPEDQEPSGPGLGATGEATAAPKTWEPRGTRPPGNQTRAGDPVDLDGGSNVASAGGRIESNPDGHVVHLPSSTRRSRGGPKATGAGRATMASASGEGRTTRTTQACNLRASIEGDGSANQASPIKRGGHEQSHRLQMAGRDEAVRVSEVEQHEQDLGGGHHPTRSSIGPGHLQSKPHRGAGHANHSHQVQCQKPEGGHHGSRRGRSSHLQDRDRNERRSGTRAASTAPTATRQRGVAIDGSTAASAHIEKTRNRGGSSKGTGERKIVIGPKREPPKGGRTVLPDTLASLTRMRLANIGNTCYVNATVFAVLWQVYQRVDVIVPEAWRKIAQKTSWTPAQFLQFQMTGWAQPRRQHDASEFLLFILPKLAWASPSFSWEARQDISGDPNRVEISRIEGGHLAHLLILGAPDGLCSSDPQNAINAWHTLDSIHALTSRPAHLFLALPRYRQLGARIVKNSIRLRLEDKSVRVPIFRPDSLAVYWEEYTITTAIVHLGETPETGHYRTAAFVPNAPGVWYSDDDRPAELYPEVPKEVAENCYVLGLLRTNEGA